MKHLALIALTALLGGCSASNFVMDAPPVPVVTETPQHFELPARFALARSVYGGLEPAGADEAPLWADVADDFDPIGHLSPLVPSGGGTRFARAGALVEMARLQRYDYLLLVRMDPSSGTADVLLFHVGSGGLMASARSVDPAGGRNGFWGGRIHNPRRLDRVTERLARATIPTVEEMLRGVVARQRQGI